MLIRSCTGRREGEGCSMLCDEARTALCRFAVAVGGAPRASSSAAEKTCGEICICVRQISSRNITPEVFPAASSAIAGLLGSCRAGLWS